MSEKEIIESPEYKQLCEQVRNARRAIEYDLVPPFGFTLEEVGNGLRTFSEVLRFPLTDEEKRAAFEFGRKFGKTIP